MYDYTIVVVQHGETPAGFYDEKLSAFENRRIFTSAVDALQHMEKEPAHIVVAEYDMPELGGLDLADAVRDIDADRDHYTYILITAEHTAAEQVSPERIDAFVARDDDAMIQHLIAAGGRLSTHLNELMVETQSLRQRCNDLEKGQLLDPLTGLGNRRLAQQTLRDSIRQVESRGGAVCFMSLAVRNFDDVVSKYDHRIANELIAGVSDRLQHLVRPLDVVTYFEPGEFALVLLQPTIEQCTADCYRRIFDNLRMKSFKTRAGFLEATIDMSLCAATAETGAPEPELLIRTARENLGRAAETENIVVKHITPGL